MTDNRKGDNAEMAIIQLVEEEVSKKAKKAAPLAEEKPAPVAEEKAEEVVAEEAPAEEATEEKAAEAKGQSNSG